MGEMTLRAFIEWCGKVQRDKKWPERTFVDEIALFHSEVSETFEEWRAGKGETETYFSESKDLPGVPKPEGIPTEFADIVIRIFAWADNHQVDMTSILQGKMNYNEQRPPRHGGKLI